MTTIRDEVKACAICRTQQQCVIITSTSRFGSPELDLRPPEPERSSLPFWVTRCSSCGYCAASIETCVSGMVDIVRTASYQTQLTNVGDPELTCSFVCSALLWEGVGHLHEAGWNMMCAAWAADDAEAPAVARRCRVRAASLYEQALASGAIEQDRVTVITCIRVDLLRRAGVFDEALSACRQALAQETDRIRRQVLDYEQRLIQQRDAGAHLVEWATRPV